MVAAGLPSPSFDPKDTRGSGGRVVRVDAWGGAEGVMGVATSAARSAGRGATGDVVVLGASLPLAASVACGDVVVAELGPVDLGVPDADAGERSRSSAREDVGAVWVARPFVATHAVGRTACVCLDARGPDRAVADWALLRLAKGGFGLPFGWGVLRGMPGLGVMD